MSIDFSLRLRENGHHFADDSFNFIFMNVNSYILIQISLKLVHMGQIHRWLVNFPHSVFLSQPHHENSIIESDLNDYLFCDNAMLLEFWCQIDNLQFLFLWHHAIDHLTIIVHGYRFQGDVGRWKRQRNNQIYDNICLSTYSAWTMRPEQNTFWRQDFQLHFFFKENLCLLIKFRWNLFLRKNSQ